MTKSIANSFKTFGRSFLLCGLCGWCMEILFTALHSLRRRDLRLTGNTSLWMFPIYGSACLLAPFKRLFAHLHISRSPWNISVGAYFGSMVSAPGITAKAVSTSTGSSGWTMLPGGSWQDCFLKRSCLEPFYSITALLLPASVPHEPFFPAPSSS